MPIPCQLIGACLPRPAGAATAFIHELARHGQLVLAAGGRPRQFTDQNLPDAAGLVDYQIDFARRTQ